MLIDTEELLNQELLPFLNSNPEPVCIDTETNWTDRYQDRYLLGIAVAKGNRTFYIPVGHASWMDEGGNNLNVPAALFRGVQAEIVFHNAKFDIHVLKRTGIEIPKNKVYDTMLMAHLINENEMNFELDTLTRKYLKVGKEKDLKASMKGDWDNMPAPIMGKYAEKDTKITLDLYNHLKEPFAEYEKVWEIDEQFMFLLQEMEQKGLPVNIPYAEELRELCLKRKREIENEIGFNPAKEKELWSNLFDPPPIGHGIKMTHKTPTGKPQVNDAFLENCNHPVAGLLQEWREIEKQVTSYYNPYINKTMGYGRLHPDFQQHGTKTGRLSCKKPNVQQIPREGLIKKLFLAESGKQLWEIDFKTVELRLAMVYSQDEKALNIFRNEEDFHKMTAEFCGISRQDGKMVNFLLAYGGSANAIHVKTGLPVKTCREVEQKVKVLFKEMYKVSEHAEHAARETKEVRLWSGRKRHLLWESEARLAFNSLIQGGSFEIVKRGMLNLRAAGFDIRSQVHDSVWIMVDSKTEVEEAEHLMADWTEELFDLKFSVESKRLN